MKQLYILPCVKCRLERYMFPLLARNIQELLWLIHNGSVQLVNLIAVVWPWPIVGCEAVIYIALCKMQT